MQPQPPATWEADLLTLAQEGWAMPAQAPEPPAVPAPLLAAAYGYCEALTAANSHSFHLATRLLPAEKRRAIRAIYAMSRISDDLMDAEPAHDEQAQAMLESWRSRVLACRPAADDPVISAWVDTRRRYNIPLCYAQQLLDGVCGDLRCRRYTCFEALAAYAYSVASTVGLMCMHVIGYQGPAALPYAIKLGVAMQLTNILRDIGEDWRTGRLYLPIDELALFGLSEAELGAGAKRLVGDARWRAFMRFQIARNRQLYAEAWPGIRLLHSDGRLAVAAAGDLYRAILEDIVEHDFDVFSRRAHLSGREKLQRLPGIWRQNR